ncbi:MAG TPA: hypothetical protein VER17_13805 [Tepidisphaeraceae bacterium]|nr:hypothetical protein [Tepidisphaeraceae bacterium]
MRTITIGRSAGPAAPAPAPAPREFAFARCTGGGTGFMYEGPLARTPGVMQVPRAGMNNFGRPTSRTTSRVQVSTAALDAARAAASRAFGRFAAIGRSGCGDARDDGGGGETASGAANGIGAGDGDEDAGNDGAGDDGAGDEGAKRAGDGDGPSRAAGVAAGVATGGTFMSFGPSCQSWCVHRRCRGASVVGRP